MNVALTTVSGLSAGTAAATVTFNQNWNSLGPNSVPCFGITPKNLATALAQPMVITDGVASFQIAFGAPPGTATAMVMDILVIGR
jgi:uncharacterized membrane protein